MKETKYIIRKIIIGVGIALCLMFIKSCNVHAVSDKWTVTVNGINLYRNHQYYEQGNATLKLNYSATLPNMVDYSYGYVALCSAAGKYDKVTSYYSNPLANTGGLGFYQDISITTTSIPCQMYNTTAYSSSTIIYFTFNSLYAQDWGATGTNGIWYKDASITFYHQSNTEYSLIGYGFSKEPFIFDDTNGALINQNETIINQNDTIINNQNQIQSSITDESSPNLNGLENSAGWLKPGPVDSIINLPLTLLNNLQTNLGKTCNPVSVTLPFVDKDINLPCITSIYKQIEGLDTWFQGVGVIAAAVILYKYFIYLYKRVDDILTLRENTMEGYFEDSLWGGM